MFNTDHCWGFSFQAAPGYQACKLVPPTARLVGPFVPWEQGTLTKSAAMSKTDQLKFITFNIIGYITGSTGGSMLGYGLAGTIVVILAILFIVRAL
jgi:hypothetical protein